MEGGSGAPEKFSLSIKSSGKKSAFNKDLVRDVEIKEETDYVTEVAGNRIKGTRKPEKKKEYIVKALANESIIHRKIRLKHGADLDKEIKQEIKEEPLEDGDVPADLANESAGPVIPIRGGDQSEEPLESAVEPSYDEMPIEEFGMALLRGMGKKSEGSEKRMSTVQPIEVKVRPKGLGLGAEQLLRSAREQQEYENRKRENDKEKLIVKSGAFVRIIEGTHKGKYGQVTGIDEDAGRVHISLALTKDKVACNEALVVAVGKQEYNDFGKCLNRDRYDDYKRKHEGDLERRPSEKIDLAAGFQGDSSKQDKSQSENGHDTKKAKAEEKRPFIGYWLRSQLRVRIVDDHWKDGRFANEKVIIEDVISRDVCLCRTDSGQLLDDVHMDMLETVLPRSSAQADVAVMVVAGKYKDQIGYIVERDKKACVAYVELVHDKSVHKFDFDYICEYVGQVS